MSKQHNQKRFTPKMRIKKGDRVVVIAGADKGVEGDVLEVFVHKNRVIVDGANIRKKHKRPTQQDPEGGIVDKAMSIHVSNVMLIDSETNERTRVGRRMEDGKMVRFSKKSDKTIS